MPDRKELADLLDRTQGYLEETLLPFWITRSPDAECGGFLTYFDRTGRPTGETTKTFLMQIRILYTMAGAHRAGLGGGRCAELAEGGAAFLLDHYWDDLHDGWLWIADRRGRAVVTDKVGYGQAFAMYAFSEYALATGDDRGRRAALRTYHAGGEWYERVDREGNPIDDALGHAWKISYHTVRSMVQVVRRLRGLARELS